MDSHSGAAMHPLETTRKGKLQQTSDRLVKYRILVNLQPASGFELPFSETGHGLGFRVPPEKHFVPAIAGLDVADGSKGKRFFSMVAPKPIKRGSVRLVQRKEPQRWFIPPFSCKP